MRCIAVSVATFWHPDPWYDKAIRFMSAPLSWLLVPWNWKKIKEVPCHVGLKLDYDDGTSTSFDATLPDDWYAKPWADQVAWAKSEPGNWIKLYPLPMILMELRQNVDNDCRSKLGVWMYAPLQLPLMAWQRWKKNGGFPETVNKVVCSEAVARILMVYLTQLLALLGKEKPDYVAPVDWTILLENVYHITPVKI